MITQLLLEPADSAGTRKRSPQPPGKSEVGIAEQKNTPTPKAIATARKVHGTAHQGFEGARVVCAVALAAKNRNSEAADEYRTFLKEAPDSSMAPRARTALAALETANKK